MSAEKVGETVHTFQLHQIKYNIKPSVLMSNLKSSAPHRDKTQGKHGVMGEERIAISARISYYRYIDIDIDIIDIYLSY